MFTTYFEYRNQIKYSMSSLPYEKRRLLNNYMKNMVWTCTIDTGEYVLASGLADQGVQMNYPNGAHKKL